MPWKETQLLRELKAKWYSFTLRSLHIVRMSFAKGNDRLAFLMPCCRDHTDAGSCVNREC